MARLIQSCNNLTELFASGISFSMGAMMLPKNCREPVFAPVSAVVIIVTL